MRAQPSRRSVLVVGGLTAVLAFVATVQLRSQAEVQRTLSAEDPTSLAFLIDDLHRANQTLAGSVTALTAQRDALRSGSTQDARAQLDAEAARLRVVEGSIAVHGPGVTLVIDAPLTALDLQDAANNLRASGAEAIAINGHRVVTGTIFVSAGDGVTVDGQEVRGPWMLTAVGEPGRLDSAADLMTRSLRGDPRVRRADYRAESDVVIRATVATRPFVYVNG